ncbi:hypothetical protein RB195_015206 [Necator americanus]|uniref:Uncharacterized protein n=1 Tax=Necator americanus TaxID=51031 RepID=A0ABR1E3G4_NECAM
MCTPIVDPRGPCKPPNKNSNKSAHNKSCAEYPELFEAEPTLSPGVGFLVYSLAEVLRFRTVLRPRLKKYTACCEEVTTSRTTSRTYFEIIIEMKFESTTRESAETELRNSLEEESVRIIDSESCS